MATLQGAILELVGVVGAVSGIKYAPNEPNERVSAWPAAFCYAADGFLQNQPANEFKALHNVQIALLMPMVDYRQATKIMLPLLEPVVNAIIAHRNSKTSAHYSTFEGISYTLGPIDWPNGEMMYGYIFTLERLKIFTALT